MKLAGFKKNSGKKMSKLFLGLVVLFVILLATTMYLSARLLGNPLVYSGVYLDGVHLGGLDKESLENYLLDKYGTDISSNELNIFHKDYALTVTFKDLNVTVSSHTIFNRIYNAGRQGNFFQRLIEIYRLQKYHSYFETEVFMDMTMVDRLIEDIYDHTYTAAGSPSLFLLDDGVYLHSGECGYAVNRDKLRTRIVEQVRQLRSGTVIVPVDKILPAKVDIDAFYSQIVQQEQDAYVEVTGGEVRVVPEVVGRALDKATFLSCVAELEAKSGKYPYEMKLPVEFIYPEKTVQIIKESLFRDKLSSYSTSFPVKTESDRKRAENIRLAVKAINGTVLLPGETFSFNDTVGMRTSAQGYQEANIYTSSGITTGIGGGVCQVSSTLYNACLEANMKIEERNPHIYTVAYVPLGRDAAVAYGSEDLRFTNSTGWPVRINGTVSGNEVSFTLEGTVEDPSLEVVIQPSVLKIIPYTTEYIEDETLAAGSSVIKQEGMNGAVVDTFFTLRSGKNIISSYKLHTTTYNPLPEIILVPPGNKKTD